MFSEREAWVGIDLEVDRECNMAATFSLNVWGVWGWLSVGVEGSLAGSLPVSFSSSSSSSIGFLKSPGLGSGDGGWLELDD